MQIAIEIKKPCELLADYVESFWMMHNQSGSGQQVVILPDGRIDLFFSKSNGDKFNVALIGIDTQPAQTVIQPGTLTFAISFRLLAVEYILGLSVADLLDSGKMLPDNFWDFSASDMNGFEQFCNKAGEKIKALAPANIDNRKKTLFDLIYASGGSIPVKALSEKVFWSSRQINRYFNQQYGISLKAYCNILRFRASLQDLRNDRLYSNPDFADQNHFIKEIKKFAGVTPGELSINQNDRFILLSVLRGE